MTNYEADIIKKLKGETPKEKYETLRELIAIEQDYKDLVIKLKEANKNPLVNVTLNQFHIIVSKL